VTEITKYLATIVLTLMSFSANAGLVLWTIEDLYFATNHEFQPPPGDPTGDPILFSELVPVTGSFIYDADTGIVSNVNITTPDGESVTGCTVVACTPASTTISPFPGFTYVDGIYNVSADRTGYFDLGDFSQILLLNLAADLTNSGGIVAIASALEFACGTACPAFDSTMAFRNGVQQTGARLVGNAVPIPAALWLFGTGLVGLGIFRRRSHSIPS